VGSVDADTGNFHRPLITLLAELIGIFSDL
jgi:hypothetical protein